MKLDRYFYFSISAVTSDVDRENVVVIFKLRRSVKDSGVPLVFFRNGNHFYKGRQVLVSYVRVQIHLCFNVVVNNFLTVIHSLVHIRRGIRTHFFAVVQQIVHFRHQLIFTVQRIAFADKTRRLVGKYDRHHPVLIKNSQSLVNSL